MDSHSALRQEIEDLRWLFETSPDLIFTTDRRGTFTHISPSSEAILGYRPDEMIGRSGADFIYPEDLEPTRDEMRLARRGRHTRNFEARYLHKEGRVVALTWSGAWSEGGQQHSFIGREVTEQKLAVEASPGGMVMIDAAGSIVLVNAETERMFGYARAELIGQSVDILVPAGFRHHHAEHRSGFAAAPEARRMGLGRDLHGLRKDGSEFPVEIGLNPIRTRRGLFVLSVVVDITERKRAEAAVQDSIARERLFPAAIIASSNDVIVTKNLDGRISGWNPAAERLFGFTAQEAIGSSIDIIVPDALRSDVRLILERIGKGEKVDHYETKRKSKDGRRIDVSLSISPIKLPSGEVIGAAKIARDITESKRAKQELFESEQMAVGIIANALDAFIQLDQAGVVIEWNPQAEAIFGWSRQEAIGKPVADLSLPEIYELRYSQMVERLQQADKHATGERFVVAARRKDGLKMTVEVSMTAIRRRGSYIFNVFVRDLTAKLAAEEQLRQSQKIEAVGQLTGGIAHDFNNMLTVITGTIDFLAKGVADKPQLAAIAKLIGDAARRCAELTSQLLAFARKQPLQPKETDINALMVESAKLLGSTLGGHVEFESRLEPAVWPALVDANQLTTALVNLAVNARDAMVDGGKLTLETSNVVLDESSAITAGIQPGHYVVIAVSDTGTGIPEEIREKVFEPFFSTKEAGKGTGLGLSMVYGFAKQSGGHVKLYSEVGRGTTVKLFLPRAEEHVDALSEVAQSSLAEGGAETILVVEDHPLVRKSVMTQLQALGYTVICTANATEALAAIKRGVAFDLLFTDVLMPGGMNGEQLAGKAAKLYPSLKVLFTSGYTENAFTHNGKLEPGVLLLSKPYAHTDLARMVRKALSSKPYVQPDTRELREG